MRRLLTVIATALVLAYLTACSPSPAQTARPSPSPTSTIEYVALGDSYTAGPLIMPLAENAPAQCFRSGANYPSYLASYLAVKSLTDVSCSGATTADLYAPPERASTIPPQLNAVTSSTDLVTVGIGGNDFNLFTTMFSAAFAGGNAGSGIRSATAVQSRVQAALSAIRARAPTARVIVVGYLRVLPENGSCAGLPASAAARHGIDAIERQLNASLEKAAVSNNMTFVDAYALSRGHDICAGSKAWVNGSTTDISQAAAFHPFRTAMDAVARAIFAEVSDKPVPKTPSLAALERVRR